MKKILVILAMLFTGPALAGSGGSGCAGLKAVEAYIACWEKVYPGLIRHDLTADETALLVRRTPELKLVSAEGMQGIWLHHPRRGGTVWIIVADKSGQIVRSGRAPISQLRHLIGKEPRTDD